MDTNTLSDISSVIFPLFLMLIFIAPIFYLIRRKRRKNESRLTPDEKSKKYAKEISTFIAIVSGILIKNLTSSWLIGGIVAGIVEIILLKLLSKKNE